MRKRWIALAIAVIFLIQDSCVYAQVLFSRGISQVESSWVSGFQVPDRLGKITDQHLSDGEKTIILIQDAHASLEAQNNIKSILDFLKQEVGTELIFFEGAMGALKPSMYHVYADINEHEKFGQNLLNLGEFTGGELFLHYEASTCREECTQALGMEDPESYLENIQAYRRIISRQNEIQNHFDESLRQFEGREFAYFNQDLKDALKAYSLFQKQQNRFAMYLQTLKNSSRTHLHMDLDNPRFQFIYPMLTRFFAVEKLEGELSRNELYMDQNRLSNWLKENRLFEDYGKSLLEIESEQDIRGALESFYFEARKKDFNFKDYPHWIRHAAYHGLSQEIEAPVLFSEIEEISEEIFNSLAKSAEEKEGVQKFLHFMLVQKLTQLEMTRDGWETYQRDKGLSEFHNQPGLTQAEDFYQGAIEREDGFIENIKAGMKSHDQAVVISGGFHSEGLKRKLKASSISYIEIAPKISEVIHSSEEKIYKHPCLKFLQCNEPFA